LIYNDFLLFAHRSMWFDSAHLSSFQIAGTLASLPTVETYLVWNDASFLVPTIRQTDIFPQLNHMETPEFFARRVISNGHILPLLHADLKYIERGPDPCLLDVILLAKTAEEPSEQGNYSGKILRKIVCQQWNKASANSEMLSLNRSDVNSKSAKEILIHSIQVPMPLSFLQVDIPIIAHVHLPKILRSFLTTSAVGLSNFRRIENSGDVDNAWRNFRSTFEQDRVHGQANLLCAAIERSCFRLWFSSLPRIILARATASFLGGSIISLSRARNSTAIMDTLISNRSYTMAQKEREGLLSYLFISFLPSRTNENCLQLSSAQRGDILTSTHCVRTPFPRNIQTVLDCDLLSYQPPKRNLDPFVNTAVNSRSGNKYRGLLPNRTQSTLPIRYNGLPPPSTASQQDEDEEFLELDLSDDEATDLQAFIGLKANILAGAASQKASAMQGRPSPLRPPLTPSGAHAATGKPDIHSQRQPKYQQPGLEPLQVIGSIDSPATLAEPKHQKPKPSNLVAPDALVTAKWALDVASQCLRCGRSSVLLPPPLSMLPSVAIMSSSYLADTNADHRVLILCEGGMEVTQRVYSYLHSVLGSIHRLCQILTTSTWTPEQGSARMIVASSVAGIRPAGISFSFVALVVPSDLIPRKYASFEREISALATDQQRRGICQDPSTVVAIPFPACVDISAMAASLRSVQALFLIDNVVFRHPHANRQVQDSLALNRPSHMFIVLSADQSRAIEAIEELAFPLLSLYWSDQGTRLQSTVPPDLASLDVAMITQSLNEARLSQSQSALTIQQLVILNVLKRATIFCANHGVHTSIAFLESALTRYADPILEDSIAKLSLISRKSVEPQSTALRRAHHIQKLLKSQRADMDNEDTAVSASRIQKGFCALVISETGKTADSLLQALSGSRDVDVLAGQKISESLLLKECDVFVAHVGQINCSTSQQRAAVEFFAQFSHIVHLSDAVSSFMGSCTPAPAEQLAQSNALRLIKVSVDASKSLEDSLSQAQNCFARTCSTLTRNGKIAGSDAQVAVNLFMSAVAEQAVASENSRRCTAIPGAKQIEGLASQLILSVGIVARHSADRLAGIFFAKLRELANSRPVHPGSNKESTMTESIVFPYLRVIMTVSSSSRCSAVHSLLDAVARHDYLSQHVEIVTEFEAESSNLNALSLGESNFRPRKRQRPASGALSQRTQFT
jgi:hypothetical protein